MSSKEWTPFILTETPKLFGSKQSESFKRNQAGLSLSNQNSIALKRLVYIFFKICRIGLLLTVCIRHRLNSVSELALIALCESKFPIGTIKTTWCRLSGQLVELIASPS